MTEPGWQVGYSRPGHRSFIKKVYGIYRFKGLMMDAFRAGSAATQTPRWTSAGSLGLRLPLGFRSPFIGHAAAVQQGSEPESRMPGHASQPHYSPWSAGALMDPMFLLNAVSDANGDRQTKGLMALQPWRSAMHALAAAFGLNRGQA